MGPTQLSRDRKQRSKLAEEESIAMEAAAAAAAAMSVSLFLPS